MTPRVRKGVLRVPFEAAHPIRAGHPFLYRDAVGNRPAAFSSGEVVDLLDEEGNFIARGLYDTEGGVSVRIFTRDVNEKLDKQAFLRRIVAAKKFREDYLLRDQESPLTAYRILHGEGDFFPGLSVDRYGDVLLIHLFTASLLPHMDAICSSLEDVWKPKSIYLQKRLRSQTGEGHREPSELLLGTPAPVEIEVQEGGLTFFVDVTAPLGTGLFPDLRLGRKKIAEQSKGKRVLNLFSYAGAISAYAASAGATQVTSVDLSAKAHARARRNFQASGLSDREHAFITGDVFTILSRMSEEKHMFDVVILDPPPFSQSHNRTFAVQKDYADLVAQALLVCAPGGMLYCCSNASRFSRAELETAIGEGSGQARRYVRVIEQVGLPKDFPVPAGFPEGNYLKFLGCAVI